MKNERGNVMLEFALIVGGLVIGTLLFVDVAGALTEYLRLAMVVNEGAKAASRAPGLEPGVFSDVDVDASIVTACQTPDPAGSPCAQMRVHQRVRFLIINTTTQLELPQTIIRSQFVRDPAVTPTNLVRVQVSSRYNGYWLPSVPLGVVREGPYLLD